MRGLVNRARSVYMADSLLRSIGSVTSGKFSAFCKLTGSKSKFMLLSRDLNGLVISLSEELLNSGAITSDDYHMLVNVSELQSIAFTRICSDFGYCY